MLERLSDKTLARLFRIAKHETAGARPFFRAPKNMIALRNENNKRLAKINNNNNPSSLGKGAADA